MTSNANEMIDNPVIAEGLKSHRLDDNIPNQISYVFILGFFYAYECCLKSIADIGPNENEDIMTGHEQAFRAVETLFINKRG